LISYLYQKTAEQITEINIKVIGYEIERMRTLVRWWSGKKS